MDNLQALAAIVGVVNGIRLLRGQDMWGFTLFLAALGVGIVFGALGLFGLSIEGGITTALASSGLYRLGEKVGGE